MMLLVRLSFLKELNGIKDKGRLVFRNKIHGRLSAPSHTLAGRGLGLTLDMTTQPPALELTSDCL